MPSSAEFTFLFLFQTYSSHNWCIIPLSHSAACVAPMEPKYLPLYSPANTRFVVCLDNMTYCMISHMYLYISHVFSPLLPPFPPPLFVLSYVITTLSSISSLLFCLFLSHCLYQSLLVPGKSPSKYGRRGSAIGIGTVEEVHV